MEKRRPFNVCVQQRPKGSAATHAPISALSWLKGAHSRTARGLGSVSAFRRAALPPAELVLRAPPGRADTGSPTLP